MQFGAGGAIEGMEDLDQSDLVIPRWGIVQPTSRFEGAETMIGKLRRNIDGVAVPSIDAVILAIKPTRILWSEDRTENAPECVSRDAVGGSLHGVCARCEFNVSANCDLLAAIRAGERPRTCNYGYNYTIASEDGDLAFIGAMGASVRPSKMLHAQFASKRRATYSAVVRFAAVREQGDQGAYYVLRGEIARWMPEPEARQWRDVYLMASSRSMREVAPEEIETPPIDDEGDLPF